MNFTFFVGPRRFVMAKVVSHDRTPIGWPVHVVLFFDTPERGERINFQRLASYVGRRKRLEGTARAPSEGIPIIVHQIATLRAVRTVFGQFQL